MDWVKALCTGVGCTVDGAAEELNPLADWVESWSQRWLGKTLNINTPKGAREVVDAMDQMSLDSSERAVRDTLADSLDVMEEAWKESQISTRSGMDLMRNLTEEEINSKTEMKKFLKLANRFYGDYNIEDIDYDE